jgi:ATP/ADP translocase
VLALVNRIFNIRPGEGPLLRWLGVLTFTLFFFLTIGYSAVDSQFMAHAGGKMIPFAWIVLGSLAIPITPWFAKLTATTRPSRLFLFIVAAGLVMMLTMWYFCYGTDRNKFLVYYAIKELYALFLLSLFWTYVNSFLDTQQAKRLVPLLGAVWSMGDFFGGRLTGPLAHALGAPSLFLIWAGGTLLLLPIVWVVDKKFNRSAPGGAKAPALKMKAIAARIRASHLLMGLALTSAGFLAVGIAMRYQYYDIFGKAFPTVEEGAAFLGRLRSWVSLFKVIMGLFLLPRLVAWFGVRNVFLLFPLSAFASLFWLASAPGVASASSGFFVVIGMGQALYDPSFNLISNVLSAGERATMRAFFSGIMNPVGALIVSAALLTVTLTGLPLWVLAAVTLTFAAAFGGAVWLVRSSYLTSVLHGLKSAGRIPFSAAEHGRLPKQWLAELEARWRTADAAQKKVIMSFYTSGEGPSPFFLDAAVTDPDPAVRTAVCRMAERRWALQPAQIAALLRDAAADVRAAAARYAGTVAFDEVDLLASLVADPDPRVRAEAAVSLWSLGDLEQVGQAVGYISRAIRGPRDEQVAALKALARLGDSKYLRTLVSFGMHPDPAVRRAAAHTVREIANPGGARWIDNVAAWLDRARGEERHDLIHAVAKIGGEESARVLLHASESGSASDFFLLRDALARIGKHAVAPAQAALTDTMRPMQTRTLALSVLNRLQPPTRKLLADLAAEGITKALELQARADALVAREGAGSQVLALLYREQLDLTRTFAIRALFAWNRYHGVRWVEQGIRSADRAVRANALEALQNLAPAKLRADLGALVDPLPGRALPDLETCLRDAAGRTGRLWREAVASLAPPGNPVREQA